MSDEGNGLDAAVQAVWQRLRTPTIERVDTLRRALVELAATGSEDARGAARWEAHKLEGALGTVGFGAGSALAGRVCDALDDGSAPGETYARLADEVASLRDQLASS